MSEYKDNVQLRGQMKPEEIVRNLINRTNLAAINPNRSIFKACVLTLMSNLPPNKLIELKDMKDLYTNEIINYKYKYSCGRPVGTVEDPVYRNNSDDWNWDGREPILVSPVPFNEIATDYHTLFEMIMRMLSEAGVMWKVDTVMVEAGAVFKNPVRTPTFAEEKE